MTQPNEVSNDMLMALADGELNEVDAQNLLRVIAADAQIAARYADFVNTRQMLQDAYPAEDVPGHLITTVMNSGKVMPLRRPLVQRAGWGLALAASVVLALGGFLAGRGTAVDIAGPVDLAQATSDLVTGEETLLPDGSSARVLASYDTDQGLCRLIDTGQERHVLCRDAEAAVWVTALRVATGSDAAFLPAADLSVIVVDSLLDELGAGPALDSDAERNALAR